MAEWDVIVVGAGGAGLAAATAAAEAGARVLLLERAGRVGGTTALSSGLISAAGTRAQRRAGIVDDTPDTHYADMKRAGQAEATSNNDALTRILAEDAPATINWLERAGATFAGPFPSAGTTHPRMLVALPNSRGIVFHLARAFRRAGGELRTGISLDGLLTDGSGRVTGIRAGGTTFAARRAVVLASGDFSSHPGLRHRFLPELDRMASVNPDSVGTGFDAALELGAEIVNGGIVRAGQLRFSPPPGKGGLISRLPPWKSIAVPMRLAVRYLPMALLKPFMMPFLATYLSPSEALFRQGAILVNTEGRRFAEETGKPGIPLAEQPGGQAFILMDQRIGRLFDTAPNAISTAPGVAYAFLRDYRRYRADLVREGRDLPAIAAAMGVSATVLGETVNAVNAGRAAGATIPPLGSGPYTALGPVQAVITTTMGGLRIDDDHRVLRSDGTVIPGLLAAGSAGYGGLVIVGQGHNLAWAFTSGRRAGLRAATTG